MKTRSHGHFNFPIPMGNDAICTIWNSAIQANASHGHKEPEVLCATSNICFGQEVCRYGGKLLNFAIAYAGKRYHNFTEWWLFSSWLFILFVHLQVLVTAKHFFARNLARVSRVQHMASHVWNMR